MADWGAIRRFVDGLMGDWPARTGGQVWTTGFRSSAEGESWYGRAGLDWLERAFPTMDADLYVAIGLMRAGEKRRSNSGVVAQPVLIVDDVGTKVDPQKWESLFAAGCPRPTARVQTSPGNETWFWALDGDATAPQRWTDLALIRACLVDRGLTDDVMDVARYVRLPGGWNSKPKYRGPDGKGQPPRVELLEWRLDADGRVSVDALGAAIVGGGADWRQTPFPSSPSGRALMTAAQVGSGLSGGALVRTADLGNPDPLMRLWQECDGHLVQRGPGVVEAHCPNMAAHTTRIDTGFAFLGGGLMHCNHASCQGLTTVDFRSMMMSAYDDRQTMRALAGQLEADEPRTAVEFLARESVRDAGGLSDTVEAQETASRMASAAEGRRAQAAAMLAAGVQSLVERFAWVNSAGVFFDTLSREVIPETAFDTHPAVLRVIPVGKSGEKRARNVVLNHDGLMCIEGLIRAGGKTDAIVDVRDDTGVVRRMANIWTPSPWWHAPRVKRHPEEWLALMEHVIPDKGPRTHLIMWFAFLLQHTGQRLLTIPLLVGAQGIGKDALLLPIRELIGHHNTQSLSMAQIGGQFTQWQLADLVVLPEMKLSADGKAYNQIKDYLASPEQWVQINEKFRRPYTTRVNFSMFGMTNHLDAIPGLEPDDRRFQIYISPASPAPKEFYDRVIPAMMQPDALAGLLDYLLSVDLTGFGPFTPMPQSSDAKREMLADTLRGSAQWTYQSVQEGGMFHGRTMLTIAEVETAALAAQNRRVAHGTDTHLVRNGLRAAGWSSAGRIRFSQARTWVWVAPEFRASPVFNYLNTIDLKAACNAEREAHEQALAARLLKP